MSSSFFTQVSTDPSSLASEFTGPNYKYSKMIKTPAKMGMGTAGGNLTSNIAGIILYINELIGGGGKASVTGEPLGDKFFITTGGQCKTSDGSKVKRSIYTDNVPKKGGSFISGLGLNIDGSQGLLPGIAEDLFALNPVGLFSAFMEDATPPCTQVTLKTIGENHTHGMGTGFIVNSEITNIDPCNFTNNTNVITGKSCTESFISANHALRKGKSRPLQSYALKKNKMAGIYTTGVGFLLIYLIHCLMKRN